MKIVHVITRFIRGGADENTLLTCNGQAALGHDVTLILGAEHHPEMVRKLAPQVRRIPLNNLVRPIQPVHDLLCLMELVSILRRIKPDVLHTHESKAGIVGRFAGALAGVPVIIHGVHILAFNEASPAAALLYKMIERAAAPLTDGFISVSPAMRDAALAAGLGRPDKHHVVESGMELDKFTCAAPADWRQMPELAALAASGPRTPIFLLITGTFEARKRIEDFIVKVFADLAADNPALILLVAGDGRERDRIEAAIDRLGLRDRVMLLGHRGDFPNVIALADICVHAAMREGLPRVVVQYAAAGKVIVTTDLPGIDMMVAPGENGYITPLADVALMQEPLRKVLADLPGFEDRARNLAHKRDFSKWDHRTMVRAIDKIYEDCLDMKKSGQLRRYGAQQDRA